MSYTRTALILGTLCLAAVGQSWIARYNGPANDEDQAWGMAVTSAGNVCVTGSSWSSSAANDIVTIAYSLTGESLWAQRYDGAAQGDDQARAIAARNEEVFVTGGCSDASLWTDMVTIAYGANGSQHWAALYNGPANGNDHGLAVATDDVGGVYAAGYTSGDTTFWEMLLVKYDATGSEQWASTYATIDEDYCIGVATDASGHVYTVGNSGSPYVLNWDYVTVKYDASNGETLWVRRYNGPANEQDEARAMTVDRDGNVIVTGGSAGPNGLDFTTIKYNPAGDSLWVRRYDGPAHSTDWAYALAVDDAGNVYVTGSSLDPATDADFATVKYLPDGTQAWVARYNGPDSGFDEAKAIAVDAAGNVYVAGTSAGSGTRSDYATIRYSSLGQEDWVQRYDGPASRDDGAVAIALGPAGAVYVTGSSTGSGTGNDFATLSYPTGGVSEGAAKCEARNANRGPTIVRGVLNLGAYSKQHTAYKAELLNVTGREVLHLKPGANDVSRLAPGVYFARSPSGVRRLVVTD
jgi:uncharacterized delta-60 repeat protein